ncbi:MAG: hypothetical protein IJW54_05160 [Clostridia bacterium]|nr:hypothetical protein [Clostridia bacterium]
MAKNFLIITEGISTEPTILESIFKKYGFNVVKSEPIKINEEDDPFDLCFSELSEKSDNVIIAQGPRNRIRDFLILANKNEQDIDRYFIKLKRNFAGIFLVYDVDHTLKDDLEEMFNKYNDETSGLLLLSSPCIEILSEPNRVEKIETEHLKTYKRERNEWVNKKSGLSMEDYIIEHFEDSVLYFIRKNCEESGNNNVMEHPSFVLEQINKFNERTFVSNDVLPVIYRYFTTTVYVCVAYIMGLTKQIDNSDEIIKFFESKKALNRRER